jgi:acyl-CoA synthetase (AMP-forming)/AMP-acid ligase II
MKELVYHRLLLPAIERNATKTAFFDGAYTGTYEQHGDRVFRLCRALGELGIGPGDRFAVMATNSHQFLELYHAAFLGAGVINPLNLRLAGKELDYIVRDSGTDVVFVDALFAQHFANAMEASDQPSPVKHVVLIGDEIEGMPAPHTVKYEELIAGSEAGVPDEPEEDDLAVLMYTGGTTGLPKGVMLDHRAEMLNLYHIGMVIPLEDDSVYLHQTPMFHAASMGGIMGTPAAGGTTVFMPLFEPGAALDLIEQHMVTQSVMVPTMIAMLLNHPDFRPERLATMKMLTYGASPMPSGLLTRLLEMYPDLDLTQGYGMTESSSLLTWLDPRDHRIGGKRLQSAGRAVAGVALTIQDDEGNVVPTGETGEVCAKAGNFMRGYWNKPEATAEVFQDGWYHTGDAGYLDDDGFLYLVDRVKDMIVTGGENVYSAEVETALTKHDAVEQAAVIGIPHETWGEQVHAVVVLRAGATVTAEELQVFARDEIAGYKVPKSVEFRTEPLPLSGAMKVLKRELRAPYWADHDRSVG